MHACVYPMHPCGSGLAPGEIGIVWSFRGILTRFGLSIGL